MASERMYSGGYNVPPGKFVLNSANPLFDFPNGPSVYKSCPNCKCHQYECRCPISYNANANKILIGANGKAPIPNIPADYTIFGYPGVGQVSAASTQSGPYGNCSACNKYGWISANTYIPNKYACRIDSRCQNDMLPPVCSAPAFVAARKNNTMAMRPNNMFLFDIYKDGLSPPSLIVKLLYQPGCKKHPLVHAFEQVVAQMTSDGTAASAQIQFKWEIVDNTLPANLFGGFPKIIKIRRDGYIEEYKGGVSSGGVGALMDFIMSPKPRFG